MDAFGLDACHNTGDMAAFYVVGQHHPARRSFAAIGR